MSELGELWKHQNKPASTESVRLQNIEVGHLTGEDEEKEKESGLKFISSQVIVERERETDRQTDRQTGRQTGRQAETDRQRQTDRQTELVLG